MNGDASGTEKMEGQGEGVEYWFFLRAMLNSLTTYNTDKNAHQQRDLYSVQIIAHLPTMAWILNWL